MPTYSELYQKVLLRVLVAHPATEGKALLASQQGVNEAHKAVARVRDFDDLIQTDTTSADTVDGTATYHIITDWGLTRPKDILSIKLMDGSNSRKLIWCPPRKVDKIIPYPADLGEQKSSYYTRRGKYIELIPIPDDAYDLTIMHSQWPVELTGDDDESSYDTAEIDDVLVHLGAEIATAILNNETKDWATRAESLLAGAFIEDATRPDSMMVAQPFQTSRVQLGEHWKKPFVMRDP